MAIAFPQFFRHHCKTTSGLILSLCFVTGTVLAQQRILLIQSSTEPVYAQFTQAMREQVKSLKIQTELQVVTADEFSINTSSSAIKVDYFIAAGVRASQLLAGLSSKKPQLMALIPASLNESHIKTNKIRCQTGICSVILLDQPIERQLQLLRLALPQHKKILVINSPHSTPMTAQLTRISHQLGMKLNYLKIISDESLIGQLTQELPDNDIVLALPDPSIYNRNTARPILLATYKYGVPIFAYSQSFIDAGASLGIYTTPEQFAWQCIDLIAESQAQPGIHWPPEAQPKYYTIGINSAVVESLGIKIPAVQYLHDQLERILQ